MDTASLRAALLDFAGSYGFRQSGSQIVVEAAHRSMDSSWVLLPPMQPQHLGDASFCSDYGLSAPLVGGSMAHGIASVRLVEELRHRGLLGFFGAAGLELSAVEAAIQRLQILEARGSVGFSLIHSPSEPDLEEALVDLYLRRGVRLIEASAFLLPTPALVRFRVSGLRLGQDGILVAPNRIIAKVSRTELAAKLFAPAPDAILAELLRRGAITEEEAHFAKDLPLAQDICGEADSGGHTDSRPSFSLIPSLLRVRDDWQQRYGSHYKLRIGAAGGIATPEALAGALMMGAAFVVTGSINQCSVEAGTSHAVRQMLAAASETDTAKAPSAGMFEMGIKVQVLKRGTLFPMRAARLFEIYRSRSSIAYFSDSERVFLETQIFRKPLATAWAETEAYLRRRQPAQLSQALLDSRQQMAWLFRSYLGQSVQWAQDGTPDRQADYQIWCGPAMGAFNHWVRGSYLEPIENRSIGAISLNLLVGSLLHLRVQYLRLFGITVPHDLSRWQPLAEEALGLNLRRPRRGLERESSSRHQGLPLD